MVPQFKFTVFDSTIAPGGLVINQPLGWKDAKLVLERDKNYHSLIEYFKGDFIWYGSALSYLQQVATTQGVDALVRVLIEIQFAAAFETLFDGLIDLSLMEELAKAQTFYKCIAPIIRNDSWAKFMNRKSIPINLQSTVDLEGNARTPVTGITLPLPSQKVRRSFEKIADADVSTADATVGLTSYQLFNNADVSKDEIAERFEYGSQISDELPTDVLKYYFKVTEGGDYTINALIAYAYVFSGVRNYDIKWFYAKRLAGVLTTTQIGATVAGTGATVNSFGFNPTLGVTETLAPGDEIYIYGKLVLSAGADVTFFAYDAVNGVSTHFDVTADTTFPDTEVDAYLIKKACESVLSKIVGADGVLISTKFDGCAGLNAINKGKHVRGFPFADKALTLSFDEIWDALKIYCLGLGYDGVNIEIEDRDEFFDPVPVVFLSNVPDMTRTNNLERYVKSVEVGYEKVITESDGGFDDPQTRHTYNTKFPTIGQDVPILSKSITASLAIEQARRNGSEPNKDYRLDEDNIIIAVKSDGGGGYLPETGADFASVVGLLNANSRYNIRHTPARILKRYQRWLSSCLFLAVGSFFSFRKGAGNYSMYSQFEDADCEATDSPDPVLAEDQDIEVENDFTLIPKISKGKIPMGWETYKTIRDNRKKALGVSQTEDNYLPMFIKILEYPVVGGYARVELELANETPVIP